MREDVIKAKVIDLTHKIEAELPDVEVDGHHLHAISKILRRILERAGNALPEDGDDA